MLVLASSSRYRAELLRKLQLPFQTAKPDIDESARTGESPLMLAQRLAKEKCDTVFARFPDQIVIGCDQTADRNGDILGKAGSFEAAALDLAKSSGQLVIFHSAVCVRKGSDYRQFVDHTRCQFRTLNAAEIDRYLLLDQAWDCAGSIKTESYGVTLLDMMETNDPTGVIGLPLMALARALRAFGLNV
jgi:septum formation protein